jgi:hypothetical protein
MIDKVGQDYSINITSGQLWEVKEISVENQPDPMSTLVMCLIIVSKLPSFFFSHCM